MALESKLAYTTEPHGDATTIYRVRGNLFGSAEGFKLQEAVRSSIADGRRRVVLDLAQVGRIDSSGVGILVAIMWSASNGGGELVLASLPAVVERVLGIAMLLPHIAHAPSVEEALAHLDSTRS
jgi:anti-anti-sigma factor